MGCPKVGTSHMLASLVRILILNGGGAGIGWLRTKMYFATRGLPAIFLWPRTFFANRKAETGSSCNFRIRRHVGCFPQLKRSSKFKSGKKDYSSSSFKMQRDNLPPPPSPSHPLPKEQKSRFGPDTKLTPDIQYKAGEARAGQAYP